MLRKPCSRKGYTSIDLKRMTKEDLRRLTDPDSLLEQYMTTPKEMKLTDSTIRIYNQEDINLVQDMLRDDEHLYVDVDTGGYIFFGTPRRLRNIIDNPIWNPINNPKYSPI